jgi:8-oxo-dGTP pyrophosphatase MutT (NUDIX family)
VSGAKPPRLQYAALPWRRRHGLEILLISSRETRRWIIPKGWPMTGLTGPAVAAREAFEEAGVTGMVGRAALGHFHYVKRRKDGGRVLCRVAVFALKVERQAPRWPEQRQRHARWCLAAFAAGAVDEPELKRIIRKFAQARQARPRRASR